MKRFAALFEAIDQSTKTNRKVAALATYFREAEETDKLWTIALFSGRRAFDRGPGRPRAPGARGALEHAPLG